MAFCKECGERIEDSDIKCVNCGYPNPNYNEDALEDVYDLDTDTVIEGDYIMPGSPGYVPVTGMKIISGGDDTPEGGSVIPEAVVPTPSAPEVVYEEVPIIHNDQETTILEPVAEEFIEPVEEPVYVAPEPVVEEPTVQEYQPYVAPEPEAEVKTYEQTAYVPPTTQSSGQGGYEPPTNNYGTQAQPEKKGGLPLPAIIGGIAVLLIAIFALMNMGKGGGDTAPAGNNMAGIWQNVAFDSEGETIGYSRGAEDAMLIELFEDGKIIFDTKGDPLEGTYVVDGSEITWDFGDGTAIKGEVDKEFMSVDSWGTMLYFAKEGSAVSAKEKEVLARAMNASELDTETSVPGDTEAVVTPPVTSGGAAPTVTEVSGMWYSFAYEDSESLTQFGRDDPEALILALTDDGQAVLEPYNDPVMGTWSIDGNDFIFKENDGIETYGTVEDGVLAMDTGGGTTIYFYQEGSEPSAKEQELMTGYVGGNNTDIADGAVVGVDYWPGDYVGVYMEDGFWGTMSGTEEPYDVTGIIDTDTETGKYYFEVYMEGVDGSLVSHYVELYDDHVEGVVGVDDAWIWDKYLTEDDEYLLWYGTLDNPQTIYLYYDYVNDAGDGGYAFNLTMRKVGEPWDDLSYKPSSVE